MKIFVTSFLILSVICGLYAQDHHNPHNGIKYVYVGGPSSCGCSKAHSYDIHVPKVEEKSSPTIKNVEYKIQVPEKSEQKDVRYIFDVQYAIKPDPPQTPKTTYSHNYEIKAEQKAVDPQLTRQIYDSYVQVPVQPTPPARTVYEGLLSKIDTIMMPNPPCNNPTHTPRTCSCNQRKSSSYSVPVHYNSRYDDHDNDNNESDINKSDSDSHSQYLPENSFESNYPDSEEYNHPRPRKFKRDVGNPLNFFKTFNLEPRKRLSKSRNKKRQSPYKKLKMTLFHNPLFKENPQEIVRNKRIPSDTSPCGYTYESCDPSKHNKEGCPLCYKCKCEPVDQKVAQSAPDFKIPYKVLGMDESPSEPSKVVIQEFTSESPAYTGLNQDQYRKYIHQILNKYPQHLAKNMPDPRTQQRDLMKFIGELANSNVERPRINDPDHMKYTLIDNAVDFYKFYQGALQNTNLGLLGDADGKPFQKRGTVLEVIELDPLLHTPSLEDILKKHE